MTTQSTKPRRLGLEINRQYFGTDSNYPPTCSGKTPKCGCRRVGLSCSPACTNCQSQSCSNVQSNPIDEDSCDIDEEIADSASVEQFMDIQQEEEEEEEIEEEITVEVEFEEYESD